LLVTLLLGVTAQAQVFKCATPGGVSYQSQPCVGGTALKHWPSPTPVDPATRRANARRLRAIQREMDARNRPQASRSRGRGRGTTAAAPAPAGQWAHISIEQNRQACAAVKAQRDAAYRAAGHHRSFALTRLWDDRIHDACR